jgi:hypothetical protein
MEAKSFDEIERTFTAKGADAAIDQLCARLRESKDYHNLFYALLLNKRHELGVSSIPTGPSQDLPNTVHEAYEDGIRDAARLVGQLYLDSGDIPQAWPYFRMLSEPAPVALALDKHRPAEDEDVQQLVHLAYYEGANPRKGFDWILERFGICNAITTLGGQDLGHPPEVRQYCIQRVVRALHDELRDRLARDIAGREGKEPTDTTLPGLLAGRDWLFQDEFAHVDVSHLSSAVQMSINLTPCPELTMARELCEYGSRLTPRLRYPGDPPFEDQYRDYGVYLAILAGERVEEGLAHFHAKAEQVDPETQDTFPAQVLVNLLLRLDRTADAVAVARRHLAAADGRQLTCPGVAELCQRASDYRTLAEVAREQGDGVHFLAGLIEASNQKSEIRNPKSES